MTKSQSYGKALLWYAEYLKDKDNSDKKKFDTNWDKIFKKKIDNEIHEHPLGIGFAHKDMKDE